MGKRELLVSLASIVCAATVSAQSRQITGTIVSENGEPVVGASIVVVGTKTGTVSDIDGKFSFNNIPVKATQVRISYLGMQVKVATIKPDMKITMYEENNQLGDVLVVAYGTAKKASYAGSASMIKSAEIADRPSTSFENALAGKVAGLQVTSSSGQAGSAPSLQIRGIGSMNAGSSPLYVIDGVPVMSGDVGQMLHTACFTVFVVAQLDGRSCILAGQLLPVKADHAGGVAVFVHLQIAEDAADSIDERVAESVVVLVYGEARYCRGETCGKAQISDGVGSEEQTLVFRALVKIELRAAQGRDVDYGRRAAGTFFALCENGQARAEQQYRRKNDAEDSPDVFAHGVSLRCILFFIGDSSQALRRLSLLLIPRAFPPRQPLRSGLLL